MTTIWIAFAAGSPAYWTDRRLWLSCTLSELARVSWWRAQGVEGPFEVRRYEVPADVADRFFAFTEAESGAGERRALVRRMSSRFGRFEVTVQVRTIGSGEAHV